VLQVCVFQPAIWHAAVAVASLQQERSTAIFNVGEEDVPLSDFTLSQYVKAMKHLRSLGGDDRRPSAEAVLLCCVFFICFEVSRGIICRPCQTDNNIQSLRGHLATALVHLDYGLRLLSEIEPEDQQGLWTPGSLHYSHTSSVLIRDLALILTRLDTQANQLLWNRKLTQNFRLEELTFGCVRNIPTFCTSLEETRRIADHIWNFCLCSLKSQKWNTSPRSGVTRATTLQLCSTKFSQSSAAFERFMEHSGTKLDAKGKQAANVMRICHLVASMCLLPAYQKDRDNEEVFRDYEKQFSEIICLATDIIDSSVDESLGRDTLRFTLDGYVLGPLFFVAVRCRHKILRRKAISLLRLSRRVEGLWDSSFLAQVAESIIEIEEGESDDSSSSAKPLRISDIDVEFDHDRRRALVGYIVKNWEDSLDAEIRAREDVVVW
jgi:hypothetical protein